MKVFLFILFFSISLFATEKSLIIVTTNQVKEESINLESFIKEKERRGFKVLLATEDQFAGGDVKGQEKVFLIRDWLKTTYKDYKYLLLIGNPHQKYGRIPMLNTFVRGENANTDQISDIDITTDQYYGYLEENWDHNGDGIFADFRNDGDGILFKQNLTVGRIPFYGDIEELDHILETAINYMNQEKSETTYRNKVLLPMSFIWFEGYVNIGVEMQENRDTADTSEWMIENIFKNYEDVIYTRLYEAEGHLPSAHEYELPLSTENILDEWYDGYGLVYWGGHGFYDKISRTVWVEDVNGNNRAENSEVTSEVLLKSGDFEGFKNKKPAFVIALSCLVGDVVPRGNLTYDMLRNGAAIGVISSTHIDDPSFNTDWNNYDSELSKTEFTLDIIGVEVFNEMLQGKRPADTLMNLRNEYGRVGTRVLEHKLMINYYGDPTLTLYDGVDDIVGKESSDEEVSDSDIFKEDVSSENNSSGCSLVIIR